MKTKFILILALTFAFVTFANAQAKTDLGKINPDTQKQVGNSLTAYYDLKDALVNSDATQASVKAEELLKTLDAVDVKKMNAAQKALWGTLSSNLKSDATHIKENDDIEHQREHFVKLSNNMYSLVYSFKANKNEAYLQYCPMKKASWLSSVKEIKNPYYGEKMLDCGSVKATLKKN